MKIIAMIPARFEASRFPGKLMKDLAGKSVIVRTYENAVSTGLFHDVYVVTDSELIFKEVEANNGKAIMSIAEHDCGSERIAEAVIGIDCDIVVNVQGDEPNVHKSALTNLLAVFKNDANKVIDLASKYNCLITAPHPFGPGLNGIKKYRVHKEAIKKIHAVEVINSVLEGKMNPKALAWATKNKKGFTGGSDGHCLEELGNSLTICRADTPQEFLDQIKRRKSTVIGKEERIMPDLVHVARKFIHEGKVMPLRQLGGVWKKRGVMTWDYLKQKVMRQQKEFFCNFHAQHHHPDLKILQSHKHTKHLVKFLKK